MNTEIRIFEDNYELKTKNLIGRGGFGTVFEIEVPKINKTLAGKLFEKKKEEYSESDLVLEFRGPNIVKVNKIYEEKVNGKPYNLILMEKAPLKDLRNFVNVIREKNLLRYIFRNPFEMIGDNFARFIIKQIVKGFETLYIGNFTHFDFKPQNTLIFSSLVMKISDFGLLRNLNKIKDKNNKVFIPGGTQGYLPPEIFSNKDNKISFEEAKILDYFALGATIFYLKFGKTMLKYTEYKDNVSTANYIIDLIQKAMDEIKATKSYDKDFIEFLCKLIQYKPKNRLSFEEIYRSKWLNKNWEQILEIVEVNQNDEEKIIEELNKSDFLIEKNNYINEKRKMLDEVNINDKYKIKDYNNKDNKNNRKTRHKVNYHKFKLKL